MPQTYNVGARSVFVTITAWVFILLGVLASLSALVQNAAVASLMPGLQIGNAPGDASLPLLNGLLVGYLPWVVGTGLVVSLATLASAIGLLLRLEPARRVFIGLLVFAIVANLVGLWLQQEVLQSVVHNTLATASIPAQALEVFGGFVTAARVMAVLMTLVACLLLGWIIRGLMSSTIRQEFA
ncbi:MAG TPA: hypothetical protein VIO33_26060 [Burkholderiaceae bacterium]